MDSVKQKLEREIESHPLLGQLEEIANIVDSTPRYVVFMGYRLGMEIALGRRLTVPEQRRVWGRLIKPWINIKKRINNVSSSNI